MILGKPAVEEQDGRVVIIIPMQLKRRGGRKEIIIPRRLDSSGPSKPMMQQPLAVALARAHRWRELLEQGRYSSLGELSEKLGVDRSYAARIMRLTLLAPDIIEAILAGREPSGTSLEQITKPIPISWQKQHTALGF